MDKICTYEVYHATDASNVEKILSEGFRYKKNKRHWLGNGFYFFLDPALAQRWAKDKIEGYGEISVPAYIKCVLNLKEEDVLDLRYLEDYNFAQECFGRFVKDMQGKYDIKNGDKQQLRTLFFTYIKKKYNYQCVIAYFSERDSLDKRTKGEKPLVFVKVPYIEVQACVSRNDVIARKWEVKL